jgi:hypothetical protein
VKGYGFICLGDDEKNMDKKIIIISAGRLGDQTFFRKKIAEIGNYLILLFTNNLLMMKNASRARMLWNSVRLNQ